MPGARAHRLHLPLDQQVAAVAPGGRAAAGHPLRPAGPGRPGAPDCHAVKACRLIADAELNVGAFAWVSTFGHV